MRIQKIIIKNMGPLRSALWEIDISQSIAVLCGQHGTGKSTFLNVAAKCLKNLLVGQSAIMPFLDEEYLVEITLSPTNSQDQPLVGEGKTFSFPSFTSLNEVRMEQFGYRVPFAKVSPTLFMPLAPMFVSHAMHHYGDYPIDILWVDDQTGWAGLKSGVDPILMTATMLDFLRRGPKLDLIHQQTLADKLHKKTLETMDTAETTLAQINDILTHAVDIELLVENGLINVRRPSLDTMLSVQRLSEAEYYAIGLVLVGLVLLPSNGILLLDSPETHLHPAAQWTIISALSARLRSGQIIIATHSPSILASRPPGELYLLERSEHIQSPKPVNHEEAILVIRDLYGRSTSEAILTALSDKSSVGILSFLIECSAPPCVVTREQGDPQLQQLALWMSGHLMSDPHDSISVVDVGAGTGDMLVAIRQSGRAGNVLYIPIEPDEHKWENIKERCKTVTDLKFELPRTKMTELVSADLVFLVNVLHELDLETRADILSKSLETTHGRGVVIIHEVAVLPVGEANFLLWNSKDIQSILGKIGIRIDISVASTYTRPGGWPLETICMRSIDRPPTSAEIFQAALSSLDEMLDRWSMTLEDGPPTGLREDLRERYQAFVMAEVANLALWIRRYRRKF